MDRDTRNRLDELTEFLSGAHPGLDPGSPASGRLGEAAREIEGSGFCQFDQRELEHGAKSAWLNAVTCIGRPYWKGLHVIDARDVRTAEEAFEACVEQLRRATNGGKIQLVMTVLPPRPRDGGGWRIWNAQLVRYAGHRQADGSIVGDAETAEFTDFAKSLGWRGNPDSPFDVLPIVLQEPGGEPRVFPLPRDAVLEVPLSHPEFPWFSELGLRWYAHPAISNQLMRIGGTDYSAAPFSGWYTCTEVAAQNLADENRYDVLPRIADGMGLDRRTTRTLWKDQALLELMRAVLFSYDQHGVTIVDHHFTARSFVRHEERETAVGRSVPGRWRSLVAPTAASTTATYKREYEERIELPNFFTLPTVPPPELHDGDGTATARAAASQVTETKYEVEVVVEIDTASRRPAGPGATDRRAASCPHASNTSLVP